MQVTSRRITLLLLGLSLLISIVPGPPASAADLRSQSSPNGGSIQPATNATTPGSTGLTFARFMLQTSPINNTEKASVAVDAQGATHVAFSGYTSVNGSRPAYYGYCASGCNNFANWTIISIGDVATFGGYVSLALNPAGLPRVTWYREVNLTNPGQYQYAQCNGECWNPGNWSIPLGITGVTEGSGGTAPWDVHYFALDPSGRARLLYTDTQTGHSGTFYRYCDAGCTGLRNWHELSLTAERWNGADLTFNAAGQPRIAFILTDAGYNDWITYVECNADCTTAAANWRGTTFYQTGSGRAFSLRMDSGGHARIALYSGYIASGDPTNNRLSYWGCDANCATVQSWHGVYVGPEGHGEDVDLALDSGDRPHLAYLVNDIINSQYGLGYALCNSGGCETPDAAWDSQIVETPEELDISAPVPPKPGCKSTWVDVGVDPDIAVDARGAPRIAYTAKHYQGVTCQIQEDIRLVRFAVATGGVIPIGFDHKTYVPLLRR